MTAPITWADAPACDDDYSHAIAAMRRGAVGHDCARCGASGYALVSVEGRVVYLCRVCLDDAHDWASARVRVQAREYSLRPDMAEMIAQGSA